MIRLSEQCKKLIKKCRKKLISLELLSKLFGKYIDTIKINEQDAANGNHLMYLFAVVGVLYLLREDTILKEIRNNLESDNS